MNPNHFKTIQMESTIRNHVDTLTTYGNRISISISDAITDDRDETTVAFNYLSACKDPRAAVRVLRVIADRLESQQNLIDEANDIINDKK